MSVYEDALTERCVEALTAYLAQAGPQRVVRLRAYLAEHGAQLEPAYKGGLIDSVIWRRTFTALEERGIAELEQKDDQLWYHLTRYARLAVAQDTYEAFRDHGDPGYDPSYFDDLEELKEKRDALLEDLLQ